MDALLSSQLAAALDRFDSLELVIVHGSAARGRLRPDSDVDIAVLAARPLEAGELAELGEAVERATGRPADIIDLTRVHGTLLARVLTAGVRLRVRDRRQLERLYCRHVYEQADFMPGYRRMLAERRARFLKPSNEASRER